MLREIKFKIINAYKKALFRGSVDYWEKRYQRDGNSGKGSYGVLAKFKAETINQFVSENEVKSVIEWGCGDGNQLELATYPKYVGLDVSEKAVEICKKKFGDEPSKSFYHYKPEFFEDKTELFKADLALSLDVIFHIVEDELFFLYMNHLFSSANHHVMVYSSNFDGAGFAHVKHRKFTDYVNKNIPEWHLKKVIKNEHPTLSKSDFFIFAKQEKND